MKHKIFKVLTVTCVDVFVQIEQSIKKLYKVSIKTVHTFYTSLHLGTRLLAKTKPNSVSSAAI